MKFYFQIILAFLLIFTENSIGKEKLIRGLVDTVGFSFTGEQIAKIVATAESLEQEALQQNIQKFQLTPGTRWIAGICPHDDHLLAARVYIHLFQHLKAKRIIIFGVAHKAWKWGAQDSLIFDSYTYWRGPYKKVKISPLREQILARLPATDFIVNNEWQAEEHSVEGIVPFIQYYLPETEIVSILVPYMNWQRIEKIARDLATVLSEIITEKHWVLGEDIAFICSNDGDHYGDQDWGGKNLAPFGADEQGYLKATQRDSNLIRNTLIGELQAKKLQSFCEQVWGEDLRSYKITWCGRFAIPFGLDCVYHLMRKLNKPPLHGYLLRYDTSYHLKKLPLLDIGLGTTAPNNIHHWVGYSAIGYK